MLGIWRANKTHAMRGRGWAWMFSETTHWIIIRIQICPSKQPLVIIYLFPFLSSCSKSTDASKRLLTCQAPSSFCIQIVRFRNAGKKMDNMVYYKEKLLFPGHDSTPTKETTVTDVPYQLKACSPWGNKDCIWLLCLFLQKRRDARKHISSFMTKMNHRRWLKWDMLLTCLL